MRLRHSVTIVVFQLDYLKKHHLALQRNIALKSSRANLASAKIYLNDDVSADLISTSSAERKLDLFCMWIVAWRSHGGGTSHQPQNLRFT
jgi:hypothetical protein